MRGSNVVSIRAPARGATCGGLPLGILTPVSIRAPARGATLLLLVGAVQAEVSIRAPARGATRAPDSHMCRLWGFNSRSREGSDSKAMLGMWPTRRFNSRSREGSDRMVTAASAAMRGFNSRSREGSDDVIDEGGFGQAVSIRAPARGATAYYSAVVGYVRVSIRAPARGATSRKIIVGKDFGVSIRAPARGATLQAGDEVWITEGFNSRSREGSDVWPCVTPFQIVIVSIRAPARGATQG